MQSQHCNYSVRVTVPVVFAKLSEHSNKVETLLPSPSPDMLSKLTESFYQEQHQGNLDSCRLEKQTTVTMTMLRAAGAGLLVMSILLVGWTPAVMSRKSVLICAPV